jgi:hypothetical protein
LSYEHHFSRRRVRSLCYPTEAEVLTYVAEFVSLFPEVDEMREPKSILEENRKTMKRGKKPGSPKTGGRKKGSRNKRTIAIEKGAKGMLPLEFMLKVMRDPKESIELRCEMAKAAAPYLHARRAPEDKGGNTVPAMIYVHPISRSRSDGLPGDHLQGFFPDWQRSAVGRNRGR